MKNVLAISVLLFVAGCASVSTRELLSSIYHVPEKDLFVTTNEVVKAIESKPIMPGIELSSEIQVTDPILLFGDSIKYRSNFRLYHFKATENQAYEIEVTSHMRKTGLTGLTYAMSPLVYILNSHGDILNSTPTNFQFHNITLLQGIVKPTMAVYFNGVLSKNDKYFILIGADNRASGRTFSSYMQDYYSRYGGVAHSWSGSVEINGYPIGSFDLALKLKTVK